MKITDKIDEDKLFDDLKIWLEEFFLKHKEKNVWERNKIAKLIKEEFKKQNRWRKSYKPRTSKVKKKKKKDPTNDRLKVLLVEEFKKGNLPSCPECKNKPMKEGNGYVCSNFFCELG